MDPRYFNTVSIVLILSISALISLILLPMKTEGVTKPVFSDNFNDNNINSSRWLTSYVGNGSTVAETNQRLEITIPANAFIPLSNSSTIVAGVSSLCQLRGDFDFQ